MSTSPAISSRATSAWTSEHDHGFSRGGSGNTLEVEAFRLAFTTYPIIASIAEDENNPLSPFCPARAMNDSM